MTVRVFCLFVSFRSLFSRGFEVVVIVAVLWFLSLLLLLRLIYYLLLAR